MYVEFSFKPLLSHVGRASLTARPLTGPLNLQSIERSIAAYENELRLAEEARQAALRKAEEAEAARAAALRAEAEARERVLKTQAEKAARAKEEAEEEEHRRFLEEVEEVERRLKEEEEARRDAEVSQFRPMSASREVTAYRELMTVSSLRLSCSCPAFARARADAFAQNAQV